MLRQLVKSYDFDDYFLKFCFNNNDSHQSREESDWWAYARQTLVASILNSMKFADKSLPVRTDIC
jgi:hypothetical protein